MRTLHPFMWIKEDSQKPVLLFFLCLSTVVMMTFHFIDTPLRTEAAPMGIVSFELAGNTETAREIIDSWGPEATLYAVFSLGYDHLFLFLYAFTIGLGCAFISQKFKPEKRFLILTGVVLSWAQIAAALLDVLENYALTVMLLSTWQGPWPETAFTAAVIKFIIVFTGILYIISGSIIISFFQNGYFKRKEPQSSR